MAVTVDQALGSRAAKPVVWVLALLPIAAMVWGVITDSLGANPAEAVIRSTGDWALRGLCVALAVTPLRQATNWNALARFRRLLGLFAFFYAVLHGISYAWLDMGWSGQALWDDVLQRPFILVGALALCTLLLLALSSPKAVLRTLGGKRWQSLHQGVHIAAWLALLHFFWMRAAKNNLQEVWVLPCRSAGIASVAAVAPPRQCKALRVAASYLLGSVLVRPGKAGITVLGKEARSLAAGSVGKYKSPRCPHAPSAAVQTARAMPRTRIW